MQRVRMTRSLVHATGVLALGNAVNRCLGMLYRMLLSRYLGAEGLGLFQMAMSLYFAILAPFITGLPSALSQVIAGWRTEGISPDTRRIVARVTIATLLLLATAGAVARGTDWMPPGENWALAKAMVPLPLLMPAIGFAVVSASLRGVFLGQQRVTPVVSAQLTEQLARLVMLAGLVFLPAAAGLALGERLHLVLWNLILGECITCALLLAAYRRALGEPWVVTRSEGTPPRLRTVLRLAVPIGLQRALGSAERLAEATLIPVILQRAGASVAGAVAVYGELTGMVIPLLYLPNVVVHALTHTLVPGVAEVLDRPPALHRRVRRALSLTAEIGAVTALALTFAGGLLTRWLFGTDGDAAYPYAGQVATFFGPVAAFLYLDHVAAAVLRGLGRATPPLLVDGVGLASRFGLLLWLGSQPGWGLPGIAIAMTVSTALVCILDVGLVAWYARMSPGKLRGLVHPFVAGVGGYAAGQTVALAFPAAHGQEEFTVMLGTAVALVAYLLLRLGATWAARS